MKVGFFLLFTIIFGFGISPVHGYSDDDLLPIFDKLMEKVTLLPEELYRIILSSHGNFSDMCRLNIQALFSMLPGRELSLANMLDSAAKFPSGFFRGVLLWPGNFDQCVNSTAPKSFLKNYFTGKYCLLQINYTDAVANVKYMKQFLPMNSIKWSQMYPLRFGVCFPSWCTITDIRNALTIWTSERENNFSDLMNKVKVSINKEDCQTKDVTGYPILRTMLIIFFAIIGGITFVGTFLDYLVMDEQDKNALPKPPTWLLKCLGPILDFMFGPKSHFRWFCTSFSLISNLENFFASSRHRHPFRIVNSLNALGFMWLIVSQTFILSLPYFWHDLGNIENFKYTSLHLILINQLHAIDTLLFLRGFLIGCFRQQTEIKSKIPQVIDDSKSKYLRILFTTIIFFLEYYIRLTIPYGIFILSMMAFSSSLRGPLTPSFEQETTACESSWWTNLFYVSNFISTENMCYQHSWYPSICMQLYLATLILFMFWIKKPIFPIIISAVLLIINVAVVGRIMLSQGVSINLFAEFSPERAHEFVHQALHSKPYSRMYPYIIGLIFGYYFFLFQREKFVPGTTSNKLNKKLKYFKCLVVVGELLILACMCIFLSVASGYFGGVYMNTTKGSMSSIEFLLVIFWPIGLSMLVAYLMTHPRGVLRIILASEFFQPLAKLSFVGYLFHYILLQLYFSSQPNTTSFNVFTLILLCCGFIVITYFLAFFFHLLFEAPIQVLTLDMIYKFEKSGWSYMNWVWFHDPYVIRYPTQQKNKKRLHRFYKLVSRVSEFALVEIHEDRSDSGDPEDFAMQPRGSQQPVIQQPIIEQPILEQAEGSASADVEYLPSRQEYVRPQLPQIERAFGRSEEVSIREDQPQPLAGIYVDLIPLLHVSRFQQQLRESDSSLAEESPLQTPVVSPIRLEESQRSEESKMSSDGDEDPPVKEGSSGTVERH